MQNIKEIIKEIKTIFTQGGNEAYFGEKVSQFEHAAQSLMLAISDEQSLEMQVAAFLHDIGHLLQPETSEKAMDIYGTKDHEYSAQQWLKNRSFSRKIQEVVKNHVPAKRYLCFKYPEYFTNLSNASKETLKFQGGMMTATEANFFENDQYFEESILLRNWDDKAKIPNIILPNLEECLEIVNNYLSINFKNRV